MASGGREDNDFAKQMKNLLNSKFTQNTFEDQNKEPFQSVFSSNLMWSWVWDEVRLKLGLSLNRWGEVVSGWNWIWGEGEVEVKLNLGNWKKELSLEEEISSYLAMNEEPSGEKKKRDNEEYYEEIEARDSRTFDSRSEFFDS